MRRSWSFLCAAAITGAALVASTSHAVSMPLDSKLPDPVAKTFQSTYPEAEMQKLDVSEEEGVTIYDIEFKDGEVERETDIAADGIMLEKTLVVDEKAVPAAAMRVIHQHAKGAKMGRLEHIEIQYETEAGKVIKLPELKTHYAAELAKGDQKAEVVVTPAGSVVEPPTWVSAKETKAAETKPEKK